MSDKRRINSRREGAEAERELIELLKDIWPDACRNIDQFGINAGGSKADVLNVEGVHFQVKRVEKLNLWTALNQAETEANAYDIPVVAFRRNRGQWYAALPLDELIPLLWLREL